MKVSEQVESILNVLIKINKEIRINLSEVKTKLETFNETLYQKEEKSHNVPSSKLEQILSQNDFRVEAIALSEAVNFKLYKLIDIKGTNMIISNHK